MGDEYIPFVQYYETEDGTICQDADLDFSVGEEKEVEGVTIEGWVARDECGDIYVYKNKPTREGCMWIDDVASSLILLPITSFPDLTWQSDPLEVTVTVKPKKKSSI